MLIKLRKGWELPESAATPEHVFFNRRRFLAGAAGAAASIAAPALAQAPAGDDPSQSRYPAQRTAPQAMQLGNQFVYLPSQRTGAGAFAGAFFVMWIHCDPF